MNRFFLITLLAMATLGTAQDNPRGEFYIKEQVKGFFSLKTELRSYTENAMNDLNSVAFKSGFGNQQTVTDTAGVLDTVYAVDARQLQYNQFGARMLGLGGEVGAQYHQLLTWVDAYFMMPQSSPVPRIANTTGLQQVRWFHYGFNLMCGWMLAPEQSVVNLIPSLGFGFNMMNIRFASKYDVPYNEASDAEMKTYRMNDRYYSNFGKDLTAQVELRMNLGAGISLGGYSGIRMSWLNRFIIESATEDYFIAQNTVAHNWFVGGKVTYTLPSVYETKEKEKL